MRQQFIQTDNLADAENACPWAAEIIKVEGGFHAFESMTDAERFKNQEGEEFPAQLFVNAKGMQEIRQALARYHTQRDFTEDMISNWASDVEMHVNNGDTAYFEIPAHRSRTGVPVICVVSRKGLDTVSD